METQNGPGILAWPQKRPEVVPASAGPQARGRAAAYTSTARNGVRAKDASLGSGNPEAAGSRERNPKRPGSSGRRSASPSWSSRRMLKEPTEEPGVNLAVRPRGAAAGLRTWRSWRHELSRPGPVRAVCAARGATGGTGGVAGGRQHAPRAPRARHARRPRDARAEATQTTQIAH